MTLPCLSLPCRVLSCSQVCKNQLEVAEGAKLEMIKEVNFLQKLKYAKETA